MNKPEKPLGRKTYGSVPHLPNSRLGPGDHKCSEGQARIATERKKNKYERIIVTEKLDGSNCGVCKKDGVIIPLVRAGYPAYTSPFRQHHLFAEWVYENQDRFQAFLNERERVAGEWLAQAHGTIYRLPHEPFVVFDLMKDDRRLSFGTLCYRVITNGFTHPAIISDGEPCSIEEALNRLWPYGYHGAQDYVEGAVWRVERYFQKRDQWEVSFLVKYVRPDKVDGCYLNEEEPVGNVWL